MENLFPPFEKEYKENIKHTMNWNDQQFDKFSKTWLYFYNKENPKTPYMSFLTPEYFDTLLSNYFVKIQMDLTNQFENKKAMLIFLLIFYNVSSQHLSKKTEQDSKVLIKLLTSLMEDKLISVKCRTIVTAFLLYFTTEWETVPDSILQSDLNLIEDLLISSDPVEIQDNHRMFYFERPEQSKFVVKKPYPTPENFFDEMFKMSRYIKDSLLRELYVQRLHKLMKAQHKNSIFPF